MLYSNIKYVCVLRVLCWGNLSLSKIIGGGGGHLAPPHPFILQICVFHVKFLTLPLNVVHYCKNTQFCFVLPNFSLSVNKSSLV